MTNDTSVSIFGTDKPRVWVGRRAEISRYGSENSKTV